MYLTGLYRQGGLHQMDLRHFVLYKLCEILDHEVRVRKVQVNYFIAPLVVVVSVVMSSDSDDSVSLSGSESELHLDDIFGDSEDKDGDFEGFTNADISAEIECQWSQTADDNCDHFTGFNAANVGPMRNNKGKNPAEIFGVFVDEEILQNIKTWTKRNAVKKRTENPRQHKTQWILVENTDELRAFFSILIAMNDLVELPRCENYFERNEQMWLFQSTVFWKVFSEKRFNQINRYIYFSDPNAPIPPRNDENFDRLHKVRPFLD